MTKNDNLTAARKLAVAARRSQGDSTRDAIISVLKKSKQPLVAREVQALLALQGLRFDISYVGQILLKLANEKMISSREETKKERAIRRGDDGRGSHFTAVYYWAPTGEKVPARTAKTVVQTAVIPIHPGKKNKKTKKAARPAPASSKQTGHSAQTMKMLIDRIVELETELARVKK